MVLGHQETGAQQGKGHEKHAFLRNEPKCNLEKNAFISLMDNELDGLQKNDKWVRFFEGTGLRDSGEFGCPQYYITEPLRFTEAQLQQARRPRSSRAATGGEPGEGLG